MKRTPPYFGAKATWDGLSCSSISYRFYCKIFVIYRQLNIEFANRSTIRQINFQVDCRLQTTLHFRFDATDPSAEQNSFHAALSVVPTKTCPNYYSPLQRNLIINSITSSSPTFPFRPNSQRLLRILGITLLVNNNNPL